MTLEEMEELIALDAVGALDPEEQSRLRKVLATQPEWRERAGEMLEIAAALAYTAPQVQPPEGLKRRILDALPPAGGRFEHVVLQPRDVRWLPWAIAALFVVLASITAMQSLRSPGRAHEYRQAHLLAADVDSPIEADISWDPAEKRGTLTARRLPPAPAGHCYQIWIIAPGRDDPVSGGVFNPAPDGSARVAIEPAAPVRGAERFLVSVEVAGGVQKAQGPMVLAGS